MKQLTTKDVMRAFDKSYMTIWNWRMGRSDKPAMPFETKARGTRAGVVFDAAKVLEWAETNSVPIADRSVFGESTVSSPSRTRMRIQLSAH